MDRRNYCQNTESRMPLNLNLQTVSNRVLDDVSSTNGLKEYSIALSTSLERFIPPYIEYWTAWLYPMLIEYAVNKTSYWIMLISISLLTGLRAAPSAA